MDLDDAMSQRRDTRHFLKDPVPEEVLTRALHCAHMGPSVGMSEPWRFVRVKSEEKRQAVYQHFLECRKEAEAKLEILDDEQRLTLHKSLKLEAIRTAPIGIAVFCEVPDGYTIGASTNPAVFEWSVACAIQNMWLSLTSDGYGMGWVSILKHQSVLEILELPHTWFPMGYLCIGRPATDYNGRPMLEQQGWKSRTKSARVIIR
ncbi:MAG: 5,6-dimethylbenzimidazole synthase [Pseudobacteriovorax sp.]|nr:5,6-dimethylbenzimidazole synthase [Pseudobacteriovorax sp.]